MTKIRTRQQVRDEDKSVHEHAKQAFAEHLMTDETELSRTFMFRKPDGSSYYAFRLTWTPGNVTLVGDVGEATLVHYHALRSFRGGMYWLRNSSYDYLCGKLSGKHEKPDPQGTFEFIWHSATEEAVEYRKSDRKELRRYRQDVAEAPAEFEKEKEDILARPEFYEARPLPTLEDFLPDREDYVQKLEFRPNPRHAYENPFRHGEKPLIAPDGYEGLYALYACSSLDVFGEPEMIFTPAGRRKLRQALYDYIHERPDLIPDLCSDLGFDDYYGSYKQDPKTIWWIEALQHGAKMICAEIEREDARLINRMGRAMKHAASVAKKMSLKRT